MKTQVIGTAKNVKQLTFNIIFNVRLIKIKIIVTKEVVEIIIKDLIK